MIKALPSSDAVKILDANEMDNELILLFKISDGCQLYINHKEANVKYTQVVIKYYEENLYFVDRKE